MAKDIFMGVSGVARKTTDAYMAVSGAARKIKDGFIGVSGVARQFWGNGFYITTAFDPSSVISGTPTYSTTTSNDILNISFTATHPGTGDDRSYYTVFIFGFKEGDVISFNFDDSAPPPYTSIDIHYGPNLNQYIKTWDDYGSGQSFSFTAESSSALRIGISIGNAYSYSNTYTINCALYNLVVNGTAIDLSSMSIT